MFSPPYIKLSRPTYSLLPKNIYYGQSFDLAIKVPSSTVSVRVAIMDLGFSTHAVHMNHRWVELKADRVGTTGLKVYGPSSTGIFPPGMELIFLIACGCSIETDLFLGSS
jgi:hypothetical protein